MEWCEYDMGPQEGVLKAVVKGNKVAIFWREKGVDRGKKEKKGWQ